MAHPGVVDSRVPRAKAAFHTLLPGLAFVLDLEALVAAVGLLMATSVIAGPRYSLFGRLYVQAIRPALGLAQGELEAVAPHRFAEALGAIFLLLGSVLLFAGSSLDWLGWTLVLIVVALAALNWLAGFCVGCRLYLLLSRFRGSNVAT